MIRACPSCGKKNRLPEARLGDRAACGRCKAPLLPLDEPVEVASERAFDELIHGSPLPVLVDFWAAWCGPCRAVAPEVKALAREHAGRLVVVKVDTESLPSLAGRYAVQGIPSFLLFRGGEPVARTAGAASAKALASQLGLGVGGRPRSPVQSAS